ncbi:MAG: MafB family polymorphic toxin, partial [Neisseriaceae bacterium]|nr:MafB family polymorphic toxin [Neisseriaceae bacterium]
MIKTIKKYLSGSLKAQAKTHNNKEITTPCIRTLRNDRSIFSGSLKHIVLTAVLGLSLHFTYADDISNTNHYLPNGKYRLFGSGRGEVQNINNNIRLHGQLTQQAGNLQIETKNYQGNLSYQQHFHNHGHRQHSPFENKAQRNFSAKKGSIVQGGATLTDLSVTGYEIHPADAYDGEQGGGYPLPTGARDEYLYEVNGKEVSVKVVALDKLPNKTHDNQLLRKAGIDPERYNQPQTNQP